MTEGANNVALFRSEENTRFDGLGDCVETTSSSVRSNRAECESTMMDVRQPRCRGGASFNRVVRKWNDTIAGEHTSDASLTSPDKVRVNPGAASRQPPYTQRDNPWPDPARAPPPLREGRTHSARDPQQGGRMPRMPSPGARTAFLWRAVPNETKRKSPYQLPDLRVPEALVEQLEDVHASADGKLTTRGHGAREGGGGNRTPGDNPLPTAASGSGQVSTLRETLDGT